MIEFLNKEHPEYSDRKEMLQRYWDFYVGGEQIRRNAARYLVRRQKEPSDVYSERVSRVFYENYAGSCIDWYAAALFRKQPGLTFDTSSSRTRRFFGEFVKDSDRLGTPLHEVIRKSFTQSLVFRETYLLVDFPRVQARASNRAEEDALGNSRAYLVPYSPQDVINWRLSSSGEFEWVVLRTERRYQETVESRGVVVERRWAVYERETYRIYQQKKREGAGQPGSTGSPNEGAVELIADGRHALAEIGKVPLVKMAVPDGLWLANKTSLLQQEHFNKSNALSWALHMGLFAMPVIYSDREWQQIVGEAYYIQLGPNDRFGWTEPEGHVFQIAADNLDRLKDEIYRVSYLMTQAGGREARHLGQSGDSKRRDFAVTHEVLRAYGSIVKDVLRQVLTLVGRARRDEVKIEVSGMDQFETPDFSVELKTALGIEQLGIGSERLRKEIHKRIALNYLDGASQDTKNEILQEIDER